MVVITFQMIPFAILKFRAPYHPYIQYNLKAFTILPNNSVLINNSTQHSLKAADRSFNHGRVMILISMQRISSLVSLNIAEAPEHKSNIYLHG